MKNIIKQFNACLALITFSLFFLVAACSNDDEQVEPEVKIPDTVPSAGLAFEQTGGAQTLTVQANMPLEVTSDKEWCVVTHKNVPTYGAYAYQVIIEVSADANPDTAERTAVISVGANGKVTNSLNVTQEAVIVLPDVGMKSDAKTLASKMYAGVNIGNTLEVPNGQNWGNNATVSKAYIKGLKTLGFNAVRIPCAWDSHADETTYQIDAEWMDKVADAVDLCLVNDMYAIINIHWDGGWLEDHILGGYSEAINTKQRTLWTQIATKFKNYDEHLLFAGCNEPGMNETASNNALMTAAAKQTIMKYEQTFVDAVRATGGNNATRCLIVQIPATRISAGLSDYSMPTDEVSGRLMVEAHFYDPYQFCLMEEDADWSKVFWYWGEANHVDGSEHNATSSSEENYVKEQFRKLKEKFVDAGYPVIIGEYSAMKRSVGENQEKHNASRAYWNEVITREAKNHGIVPFYWETNGDINRSTGEAKEKYAIDGIMKGAADGNYPY